MRASELKNIVKKSFEALCKPYPVVWCNFMLGRREKGTGSIFKKGDHYYLRVRTGNAAKVSVLRDKKGLPITNQKEVQKAAVK